MRAAVFRLVSTALEFMDFQLYSRRGSGLQEIFFPNKVRAAAMALILAMGHLWCRLYSQNYRRAFAFGKMGDRIGRKVLFITITMMGICTTPIGVLPTYAQIGIFAPVLALRIIQGWAPGGNFRRGQPCWPSMRRKAKAWYHFLAGRDGHQLRYVERDGDSAVMFCA